MLKHSINLLSILLLLFMCAVSIKAQEKVMKHDITPKVEKAVAVIYPTKGNTAHGVITFIKVKDGMKVIADIEGLTPGKHGFHVHEYGDCSASDGSSAGGHFNPDNVKHSGHDSKVRHVGDLGNITADKDGKAHLELVDDQMEFFGSHGIIGRGVVVHGGTDDLISQPSGNAGPRVGCGVIGIAKN